MQGGEREREREREYNTGLTSFLSCICTKKDHYTSLYIFNVKLAESHKGLSWQEDEEIKSLGEE